MLDTQALLVKHLDPATFGSAIATAVSSALTATIGTNTIGSEVSKGLSKDMEDIPIPVLQAGISTTTKAPKAPGTTTVRSGVCTAITLCGLELATRVGFAPTRPL